MDFEAYWTSTEGARTVRVSTAVSRRRAGEPSVIRAQSVEVPPISSVIKFPRSKLELLAKEILEAVVIKEHTVFRFLCYDVCNTSYSASGSRP